MVDFTGEHYYKLNRFLLLSLGLWPYQNLVLKVIQVIIVQTLFMCYLILQFITVFMKQCDLNIFLKCMTCIVLNIIYIIKYNGFLLLSNDVRHIFDRIQYDWNTLKSPAERKIIEKYAGIARFYTIQFFSVVTITVLTYIIICCEPIMLDMIMPMNESRSRPIYFMIGFFDRDIYFKSLLAFSVVHNYIGCVIITAVAMIPIAYALHTCALFKITSYHIERIFANGVLQKPKDIKQRILYEKLIYAVYVHRRAIDLTNILTSRFAIFYFVLLIFGVTVTSLTFYRFLNSAMLLDNVLEVLFLSGIIFVELYYIFLGNYIGQSVIDTSADVHTITYNTQWYAAPLWTQKSLLFVIQRSSKRSALTAGSLYHASLEGFATLMNVSMSYVMLFLSLWSQQPKPEEKL